MYTALLYYAIKLLLIMMLAFFIIIIDSFGDYTFVQWNLLVKTVKLKL